MDGQVRAGWACSRGAGAWRGRGVGRHPFLRPKYNLPPGPSPTTNTHTHHTQDVVYKDVIEPLESVSVSLVPTEKKDVRGSRGCSALGGRAAAARPACVLPAAAGAAPALQGAASLPAGSHPSDAPPSCRRSSRPCCPPPGHRVWRAQRGGLHASRQGAHRAVPGSQAAGRHRGAPWGCQARQGSGAGMESAGRRRLPAQTQACAAPSPPTLRPAAT